MISKYRFYICKISENVFVKIALTSLCVCVPMNTEFSYSNNLKILETSVCLPIPTFVTFPFVPN